MRVEKLSQCLYFGKSDDVRKQFACIIAANGLREYFLRTRFMEINGQILSDALLIRKRAYYYKTVIGGLKVNVENVSKEKKGS